MLTIVLVGQDKEQTQGDDCVKTLGEDNYWQATEKDLEEINSMHRSDLGL